VPTAIPSILPVPVDPPTPTATPEPTAAPTATPCPRDDDDDRVLRKCRCNGEKCDD
jgi:hypothetical protein